MFELITALPTAFDEEGLIQTKGIKEMVRFNIDNNKVDGLYVGGSTGEAFLLSFEDKKELFKAVAEENQGAVKLMAQIGSLNINESMELACYVEALGYDVVSAVPPFYYKFSKEEVLNYFINRSTNAHAESLNSKLKGFRAQLRGVQDLPFFMFRASIVFG